MSTKTESTDFKQVIAFWFEELDAKQWWQKDLQIDKAITQRFAQLHHRVVANEMALWRETALGSLAEVIVLDQFSRNIYRDQAQSFAADAQALALAQCAIDKGFDTQLPEQQRLFLYMPYMHSESAFIHTLAVGLFEQLGLASNLEFELKHKAIIDKFGRYPHRNTILKRQSSQEELDFLNQPGSSF